MGEKQSNEITLKIKNNVKDIEDILKHKKFNVIDEFTLDDTYLIPKKLEIENISAREILANAVIIRNINDKTYKRNIKLVTFKSKEINDNGDIISQKSTNCEITDIKAAKELFYEIGYKEIMQIKENDKVYEKEEFQIAVKDIINSDSLIEIETSEKEDLDTIEKIKEKLNKLNLPVDTSNYFVKKAEIEINKILNK